MELFLQMGHGMQSMAIELIKKWNKGTLILSPVNIAPDKILGYSERVRNVGGNILFDPQMFYPKEGHIKLQKYDYWPTDNASIGTEQTIKSIVRELVKINVSLCTEKIILPSIEMNDIKLKYGYDFICSCTEYVRQTSSKEILATICLYPEMIRSQETLEIIIENLKTLPVNGFYIVPHPPNGEYIVSDYLWMMGMLKLVTCLKLHKKYVIVGYSNHQALIYATSKVDAIASGTFMNTRSFNPAKFKSPKDDDIKQKSKWYYSPAAMCEYKAALLDVAKQRDFLDMFMPQGNFSNPYSEMLFKGAMPSSTNYNESNSFKHYLWCLNEQCSMLPTESYKKCYDAYNFMLDSAEHQSEEFKKKGIRGQNRDFTPALEVNRMAVVSVEEDYGLRLQLDWDYV